MNEKQRTIAKSASLEGVGLHTGNISTITFNPAPENYGYKFVRTDVDDKLEIEAIVDNVIDLSRGTTIAKNNIEVHTVEHVLASLVGLGIDNCRIELSANEPPVGDGSAMPYVEVLKSAGVVEQSADRKYFEIPEIVRFTNDEKGVDLVALPHGDYRLTVMIDYANPALGSQHTGLFDFDKEFVKDFAPARTFCFLTEVQMLHKQGLIKGGNLDSAIVIVDKDVAKGELSEIKEVFKLSNEPKLGSNGILDERELRFRNEPARHKLLDMIGDLALVGVPIKAQILAARPGHASNIELARKIRELYKKTEHIKKLDPNNHTEFVFDINEIMDILPHRYPFLLLDRVLSYDSETKTMLAYKNVTFNEPHFTGHFPNKPIMPGVLILEVMAQAGGILILKENGDSVRGKIAYFSSINHAKFRKPVIPGDQLMIEVKLISKKFNAYLFSSKAYVSGKVVAEAELQAVLA